ncbi:class I SAM-dependent methyltransferase [Rhodospirillaceae bacterium SYSU D60014]|uniref:class I SAM-dependent methyltransferase n=1 Tax=Virgifigura deserti TaxID=2268457 RepID=UPI000E6643E9
MFGRLTRWVWTALPRRIERMAGNRLQEVLLGIVQARAARLPPDEALRFVLGLEAALYPIEGRLSVAYGGGLHTKHRHMRYHDFFVDRIASGERVLDIGCGLGKLAYEIAERSDAIVTAVDLVPRNIEIATQRFAHPRVTYKIADATRQMEDGPFNVVVLSNVLEHLHERPDFLRRVRAAALPDRFLIRVPLFERDWRVPLKKELGLEWRLDQDHKVEYTYEAFVGELREAGLRLTYHEIRWGEIWAEAVPNG